MMNTNGYQNYGSGYGYAAGYGSNYGSSYGYGSSNSAGYGIGQVDYYGGYGQTGYDSADSASSVSGVQYGSPYVTAYTGAGYANAGWSSADYSNSGATAYGTGSAGSAGSVGSANYGASSDSNYSANYGNAGYGAYDNASYDAGASYDTSAYSYDSYGSYAANTASAGAAYAPSDYAYGANAVAGVGAATAAASNAWGAYQAAQPAYGVAGAAGYQTTAAPAYGQPGFSGTGPIGGLQEHTLNLEEAQGKTKRKRKKATFFTILLDIELVIAIVLLCVLVFPRSFGFVPDVVQSASMEPSIPVGSIVYTNTNVAGDSLQVGDIAQYQSYGSVNVLHRVAGVSDSGYTFKGDNNKDADKANVKPNQIVGKYVCHMPFAGYIYKYFDDYRIAIIAGLAAVNLVALAFHIVSRKNARANS